MILDPKTSRRIFELARDQQDELGEKDLDDEDEDMIPVALDEEDIRRGGESSEELEEIDAGVDGTDGVEHGRGLTVGFGDDGGIGDLIKGDTGDCVGHGVEGVCGRSWTGSVGSGWGKRQGVSGVRDRLSQIPYFSHFSLVFYGLLGL